MQTRARRESREEWARRVARWRRSGLAAREFAERCGVNRHTLVHWAWRLGTEAAASAEVSPSGRFVEIVGALSGPVLEAPRESPADSERRPSLELVLRDGLLLRVEMPVDARTAAKLATFVAALEAR